MEILVSNVRTILSLLLLLTASSCKHIYNLFFSTICLPNATTLSALSVYFDFYVCEKVDQIRRRISFPKRPSYSANKNSNLLIFTTFHVGSEGSFDQTDLIDFSTSSLQLRCHHPGIVRIQSQVNSHTCD